METLKEGVVQSPYRYKKRRILKTWKAKYIAVTPTKFLYYSRYKSQNPRRIEDRLSFSVPGEIVQRKQLFTFKLVHAQASKKNLTLGVYSLQEAKQWVSLFKLDSPTQSPSRPQSLRIQEVPKPQKPFSSSVKPKAPNLTDVLRLFADSESWKITSSLRWEKAGLIKRQVIIPNLPMNIIEAIEKERTGWDWALDQYRVITQMGDFKIIHAVIQAKQCTLLSLLFHDSSKTYVIQRTVPHAYYPSQIDYFQYFCVSEHSIKDNSCAVTMITNLPSLAKPFKSLAHHMDLQEFKTDLEEGPILAIPQQAPQANCYSFDEFFVYGPGGSYERDELKGSLVLKDKDILTRQKKVLGYMLRTIGKNLLSGKGVMNVSFPVTIFSPMSVLERTCAMFGYAPMFMERAMEFADLEKFKHMLAFSMTILHLSTDQRKPFNPILGETYQGVLGPMAVYSEQTSHHPPVSSFQLCGHNYEIIGFNEYVASTSFNSVKGRQMGEMKLIVGEDLYFLSLPQVIITGITYGARVFTYVGVMTLMDPKNRLFCELIFNPYKKGYFGKGKSTNDYFKGIICRVGDRHQMMTREGRRKIEEDGKKPVVGSVSDKNEELGVVDGYWPLFLQADGIRYWDFDSYRPYKLLGVPTPLPSDSVLRKDLQALLVGNEDLAQKAKEQLETLQRNDRKLRERVS